MVTTWAMWRWCAAMWPLLMAAAAAAPASPPMAMAKAMAQNKGDIDTHSRLEQHSMDLKDAQQEVSHPGHGHAAPTKKAEERRVDLVHHLVDSARAAKDAQGRSTEQLPPEPQVEDEDPQGMQGFGPWVHSNDPHLASVNVVHVKHLPPQNVKELKHVVGKMREVVQGDPNDQGQQPKGQLPMAPPEEQAAADAAKPAQEQMGPAAQAVAARHEAIVHATPHAKEVDQAHTAFKAAMENHAVNMHQALADHAAEMARKAIEERAEVLRVRAEEEANRLEAARQKAEAEKRKAEDAALRLRAAEVNEKMQHEEAERQAKAQAEAARLSAAKAEAAKAMAAKKAANEAKAEKTAAAKAAGQAEAEDAAAAKVAVKQVQEDAKGKAEREEAHKKVLEYREQQKALREKAAKAEQAVEVEARQAAFERAEAERLEREVASERGDGGPVVPSLPPDTGLHSGATQLAGRTGLLLAAVVAAVVAA